jgi:hypothetical protein
VALNISNASKYKGNLQSLKDIAKKQQDFLPFLNTMDALARAVGSVIYELQKSLKEKEVNATGSLSQSILATPGNVTREKAEITISYNKYGDDVDLGTAPKGFSINALKELQPKIYRWIISPGKAKRFGDVAKDRKKSRSLSFIIAMAILKKGTRATYWKTDVTGQNFERINNFLSQEISKALGRDVSIIIKNEVENLNGNNS